MNETIIRDSRASLMFYMVLIGMQYVLLGMFVAYLEINFMWFFLIIIFIFMFIFLIQIMLNFIKPKIRIIINEQGIHFGRPFRLAPSHSLVKWEDLLYTSMGAARMISWVQLNVKPYKDKTNKYAVFTNGTGVSCHTLIDKINNYSKSRVEETQKLFEHQLDTKRMKIKNRNANK